MGVQWSKVNAGLQNFSLTNQTRSLSEQSANKNLAKVQKLVLEQYPYLIGVRESMLVTDCALPDCPIIFANDSFEKMTLYPKEEIINRNCRFLQGKHTNKDSVARIRDAVQNEKAIEVEILNYRKDGVAFWNNFLMLPVFKGKKCRYFIAIQKNITIFKKDNPTECWTPAEVAMWLEHHGLHSFAQRIIQNQVSGQKFLALSRSKALKYGIILRSNQEDILAASEYLRKHIDAPFRKTANDDSVYTDTVKDSVNFSIDTQKPSELKYWEREGAPSETILFKSYFRDQIFLFLWPASTVSLEIVETEICAHFGIKNARLSHVNFETKESAVLYTNDAFNDVLRNEEGTVKIYVEEEEKDLLSLTSILYKVPDPILVVNGLLHVLFSNEIANNILGVTNASFLPNATQILPELPVDFPKHPHIKTIFSTPRGVLPVDISITSHKDSAFMIMIRPTGFTSEAIETESYREKHLRHRKLSYHGIDTPAGPDLCEDEKNVLSVADEEEDKTISTNDTNDTNDTNGFADSLELPSISASSSADENINGESSSTISIKEGDKEQLKRTLDQILFASSDEMISMFLSSYKMFHTKETILEELFMFTEYYFNAETLKKTKETELYENLHRNFVFLLNSWVDMFPFDFKSPTFRNNFINLLQQFPGYMQTNAIKLKLLKALKTKKSNVPLIDTFVLGLITHTSSQDIANALTAKDTMLFKRIKAKEFYKCSWMKAEKYQLSPNLLELSSSFETLTNWISKCILISGAKTRAKRIKKFISIAQRLLQLNNFHTMMAVVSGLGVVHVSRLKRTWALVPQQSKTILNEMQILMDSSNNFSQYRKALNRVVDTPGMFGIPYMPVILRDMTYTYEAISDDCTVDNVALMGKQLSLVFSLQNRDLSAENFTVKDSLLHFFATIDTQADEEQLYELSLQLEPISQSSPSLIRARAGNRSVTR